jgi:uncharacterized protein
MKQPGTVQLRWNVRIPLRDGVHLSGILYLPSGHEAPSPAILTMTPYIAQTHHQSGTYFASHGYPFLSVDVRGRGESDGAFHPRNEASDGYDVVEWLARQPYCNGKVAMSGGSYLGRCQWAAASGQPRHLATIVPVAAPYYGVDVPLRNNVFVPYTVRWLAILQGRQLQDKIFADQLFWTGQFKQCFKSSIPFGRLDERVGFPSALFQEWLAHPNRDAYWDSYEPTRDQYSEIGVPVLTITGAYDGDQPGALEHYRCHVESAPENRARHYLVIGPWDHGGTTMPRAEIGGLRVGPESLVDLMQLHLDWYAWTMGDGPRPEFLRKNVAYYVTGTEVWRYAESLEGITAYSVPLYLTSTENATDVFRSGSLERGCRARSEPDHYCYDPTDVSHAELEAGIDAASLIDQRMVYAMSGKQFIYHSAPFSLDIEIAGFFRLQLWLSINQADTDVHAAVYEVASDGSVVRLTSDWMRARYRESLREAKLIDTTAPQRYDFERFTFVARRIQKGHRLRLVLGPINSMHWQKNYNSGGVVAMESVADARPVLVRLFHDEQHPSALHVPFASVNADA